MSGLGRGRSWMKLDKEIKPGIDTNDTNHSLHVEPNSNEIIPHIPSCVPIKPEFETIVDGIRSLCDTDDGIKLNKKLKHIIGDVRTICQTEKEAAEMMHYLHEKALEDDKLIPNFVKFTFLPAMRSHSNYHYMRKVLITKMQNDFEDAENQQQLNKYRFYNQIRLLGCLTKNSGRSLVFALLGYFEILLESATAMEIEMFATLLYENENSINAYSPRDKRVEEAIARITLRVKELLTTNNNLSNISKTWLLFANDFISRDFRMLPTELMQWYQSKLLKLPTVMPSLQTLTIETNYEHNTYRDEKHTNLLEVANSHKISPKNRNVDNNLDQLQMAQKNQHQPGKKTGRPILGAGARSFKPMQNHEDERRRNKPTSPLSSSNWTASNGQVWGN